MCASEEQNTAPRHSIDLVLGASHSRMDLTFLPMSASRVDGRSPAASLLTYYKVKSILGSGQL